MRRNNSFLLMLENSLSLGRSKANATTFIRSKLREISKLIKCIFNLLHFLTAVLSIENHVIFFYVTFKFEHIVNVRPRIKSMYLKYVFSLSNEYNTC